MVIVLECSKPYHEFKIERFGACTRVIFAWFSVAYIPHEFNDISRAIREDERRRLVVAADCKEKE